MERQLRMGGGIMSLEPRQQYGLGSFVKKAVKGVTGAVKGAVSGIKDLVKSDAGKLLGIAALSFGIPGTQFGGLFGRAKMFGPATGLFGQQGIGPTFGAFKSTPFGEAIFGKAIGDTDMTRTGGLLNNKMLQGALAGTVLGGALGGGLPSDEEGATVGGGRNIGALRTRLEKAYRELRYPEEEIPALVEADLAEYTQGAGGYANGGRIGFQQGGNFDFNKFLQDRTREAMQVEGIGQAIRPVVESNVRAQAARDLSQAARGGDIESFLTGQLGSGITPYISRMQSPMTGTSKFGRQQVIDALTKSYMNQYSAPTDSAYDQMRFAAPGQSGSFVEMPGGQFGDGMGIVIDGKQYATEQEAINNVGLERYNMFYADGGRIGFNSGSDDYESKFMKLVGELMEAGFSQQQAIEEARERLSENKANGGRIGYSEGSDDYESKFMKLVSELMEAGFSQQQAIEEARERLSENKADGGRIGYAFGNNPEQNAINAAGIMGLPLNQNPAGATELDMRDTGGFIPPVGVKEKEDDIPAMLSNNEFVFTADAVRGMGDGNVNVGAQRMYDMMKKLENGGRV
jgi:hypothetical protein